MKNLTLLTALILTGCQYADVTGPNGTTITAAERQTIAVDQARAARLQKAGDRCSNMGFSVDSADWKNCRLQLVIAAEKAINDANNVNNLIILGGY